MYSRGEVGNHVVKKKTGNMPGQRRSVVFESSGKARFSQWTSEICYSKMVYVRSAQNPDDWEEGRVVIISSWRQKKTGSEKWENPSYSEATMDYFKSMF
jgi:hypothetical protein